MLGSEKTLLQILIWSSGVRLESGELPMFSTTYLMPILFYVYVSLHLNLLSPIFDTIISLVPWTCSFEQKQCKPIWTCAEKEQLCSLLWALSFPRGNMTVFISLPLAANHNWELSESLRQNQPKKEHINIRFYHIKL